MDHADAFRRCLRIRTVEDRLPKLKAGGLIQGSLHLCSGQEAIPVATCDQLRQQDRVVCTYRGHGWVIAQGVPLADFFGELMGRDSTLCGGRGAQPIFRRRPTDCSERTRSSAAACRSRSDRPCVGAAPGRRCDRRGDR